MKLRGWFRRPRLVQPRETQEPQSLAELEGRELERDRIPDNTARCLRGAVAGSRSERLVATRDLAAP